MGGLICWENYMPLARYYMYSQGIDIWVAPTLATGDSWVATMRHIAREGRLTSSASTRACGSTRSRTTSRPGTRSGPSTPTTRPDWVSPGNSVIIGPTGKMLAGPSRHEETILYAEVDPSEVRAARRYLDPTGHYNRPDIFRLTVDTRPRPAVSTVAIDADPG